MQPLIALWSSLSIRQRLTAIFSTLAVFAAILMIARLAAAPSMALLYNGLEPGAAGEVVRALEQRGVAHDVRAGAIYVDSKERDQLRLTLASEGLPANGTKGYELLDSLSGFGTTAQMFDAAYWRAKEGELARTIAGSSQITSARVHISQINSGAFQRQSQASASVTVHTTGGGMSANQVRALKFLVASAVAGLSPDDVAVIDGATGLVTADDGALETAAGTDRSEDLRQKVQRLLEARVGQGNAVVEVSLDLVNETESIRERIFDPASRVAISTDTEQKKTNAKDSGGADVTVASNLPDGDAAGGNSSSSENSESRERVNYEVSETERQITRGPGEIRRVTVAVLVNHAQSVNDAGEVVFAPRPEEEIAVLEELVSSAVGFDADRGDKITLKSLPFEPVLLQGSEAGGGLFQMSNIDVLSFIQIGVLALVSLILGLFVLRPILATAPEALPAPDSPLALNALPAGEGASPSSEASLVVDGSIPGAIEKQETAGERLRELISGRQDETIEILRSWMDEGEEKA